MEYSFSQSFVANAHPQLLKISRLRMLLIQHNISFMAINNNNDNNNNNNNNNNKMFTSRRYSLKKKQLGDGMIKLWLH